MAQQARRTLRSLSTSSCSSLSSLGSISTSISPPLVGGNSPGGPSQEAEAQCQNLPGPPLQVEPPPEKVSGTLGKRKRKRNPEKARAAKKRRANQRGHDRSKKEGIEISKQRLGKKQAVQTGVEFGSLHREVRMDGSHQGCSMEDLDRAGVKVVPWDGV